MFYIKFFSSNFLPSINYWFFNTITGITGILLVVLMSIIYVFSTPPIMKSRPFLFFNNDCLGAYHAFRITHLLNVLLYVLTFLHGLPKLLDVNFYLFFKTYFRRQNFGIL